MSKHRKHTREQQQPQAEGKKARERQVRQQQARQRMRFHMFTALALLVVDKWQTNEALQEDIADLPANERRYLKMQIAVAHKAVCTVVRRLHDKDQWPSPTSSFFVDASERVRFLLDKICTAPRMPEYCRHMDVHAVLHYLVYAALYEWWRMAEQDVSEAAANMIKQLGILGDHLIPNDSPCLDGMNDVFWQTRAYLHSHAPLPVWDFSKCPPGSAEYEHRHGRYV